MKHANLSIQTLALAAMVLGSMQGVASAQDDEKIIEARIINFDPKAVVDGSTATMWLLSIGLLIVVVGVMFKNANRSHLD